MGKTATHLNRTVPIRNISFRTSQFSGLIATSRDREVGRQPSRRLTIHLGGEWFICLTELEYPQTRNFEPGQTWIVSNTPHNGGPNTCNKLRKQNRFACLWYKLEVQRPYVEIHVPHESTRALHGQTKVEASTMHSIHALLRKLACQNPHHPCATSKRWPCPHNWRNPKWRKLKRVSSQSLRLFFLASFYAHSPCSSSELRELGLNRPCLCRIQPSFLRQDAGRSVLTHLG